ncbi:MAG: anion permease [Bradyrhizobium sp.]|uniref:anion permease n=1 Tax=Bradyrhizobium sp. TaxID=376 RepID=UPI00391A477F
MFSIGYRKSGLGRRLALLLVRGLGRRTIGLGYAVAFSDLVLAPTISHTVLSEKPLSIQRSDLFGSGST